MNTLSVKHLRTKFPFVRSQLRKGESFLIIYKSQPIAQLSPIETLSDLKEASDLDIERAAVSDLDDDYLTPEEVRYYLSLKKR